MSRQSEKVVNAFNRYLKEHHIDENEQDSVETALKQFMVDYNENIEKDQYCYDDEADCYYEMAMDSEDCLYAKRMLKKAIKVRPDHIDAHLQLALLEDDVDKEEVKLLDVEAMAKAQLVAQGYMEADMIGHFWGIIETRPYIRVLYQLALMYRGRQQFRKAIHWFKEVSRLNEGDNLGCRFSLLSLYAILEEEENAVALFSKYEQEATPTLLYMCALYYKLGKVTEAKRYLKRLCKVNPHTKKVFAKDFLGNLCYMMDAEEIPTYYQPYSEEELYVYCADAVDMFINTYFVYWLSKNV